MIHSRPSSHARGLFALSLNLPASTSIAAFALLAGVLLIAGGASAGLTIYTDDNVGGFVDDSASEAFLTAIDNSPTEYLSFATDKDGGSFLDLVDEAEDFDGEVLGSSFSYNLVLSQPGSSSVQLTVARDTGFAHSGPSSFSGPLEIGFPAYATAVGLGPVGFGSNDSITVYDTDEPPNVLYSGNPLGDCIDSCFKFVGFTTDEGDRIGRVVVDGDFYSVQDLQFVPEPSGLAQAVVVVTTLAAIGRRRRVRS